MNRGTIVKPDGSRGWGCRWYDASGIRRFKGGFRTKAEASAHLDERLVEARQGTLYEPRLSYADLVDRFLAAYEAAPNTVERMKHMLAKSVTEFGARQLRDLRPDEIQTWRKSMSPGTAWDAVRALRQALEWGVEMRLLTQNVARRVKNPQPKPKVFDPFECWSEIDAVAAELDPRYADIPAFAVGTGLRPGEWMALQARDIDLAAREVTVRRACGPDGRLKTTNSLRVVPLRRRTLDAVAHVADLKRRDLVFPSARGGVLDLHNWRNREWNPAVEAAGLDRRRPYDMRHTYASWSLRAGVNTFQLAKRMGTSLEMIDKHYGHLARDSAEHELRMLDEFDDLRD